MIVADGQDNSKIFFIGHFTQTPPMTILALSRRKIDEGGAKCKRRPSVVPYFAFDLMRRGSLFLTLKRSREGPTRKCGGCTYNRFEGDGKRT